MNNFVQRLYPLQYFRFRRKRSNNLKAPNSQLENELTREYKKEWVKCLMEYWNGLDQCPSGKRSDLMQQVVKFSLQIKQSNIPNAGTNS